MFYSKIRAFIINLVEKSATQKKSRKFWQHLKAQKILGKRVQKFISYQF